MSEEKSKDLAALTIVLFRLFSVIVQYVDELPAVEFRELLFRRQILSSVQVVLVKSSFFQARRIM